MKKPAKPRKPKRVITSAEKAAVTRAYNRGYVRAGRNAQDRIAEADERAGKAERQMRTLDRLLLDRDNRLRENRLRLDALEEKNGNLIAAYMEGFTEAEYKQPQRFSTWELICGADKAAFLQI